MLKDRVYNPYFLFLVRSKLYQRLLLLIYDKKIYDIYVQSLQKAHDKLLSLDPNWKYSMSPNPGILRIIKQIVWKKLGLDKYNISLGISTTKENR